MTKLSILNFILIIGTIIFLYNINTPQKGYEYSKYCISFVDQNSCSYVDAGTFMCYNNCEFPSEIKNIVPEYLKVYCKESKNLTCKTYVKVEQLQ